MLQTTPEHPFYTEEAGWVPAGSLWAGAHISRAEGGWGAVEGLMEEQRPEVMYNLTVETAHTFFVGGERLLVHNECAPPGPPGPCREAPTFGRPGRGRNVREYDGDLDDAWRQFLLWTQGIKPEEIPDRPGFYRATLPNGAVVVFRPTSRSVWPTVDVHNCPGQPNYEVKFVGK